MALMQVSEPVVEPVPEPDPTDLSTIPYYNLGFHSASLGEKDPRTVVKRLNGILQVLSMFHKFDKQMYEWDCQAFCGGLFQFTLNLWLSGTKLILEAHPSEHHFGFSYLVKAIITKCNGGQLPPPYSPHWRSLQPPDEDIEDIEPRFGKLAAAVAELDKSPTAVAELDKSPTVETLIETIDCIHNGLIVRDWGLGAAHYIEDFSRRPLVPSNIVNKEIIDKLVEILSVIADPLICDSVVCSFANFSENPASREFIRRHIELFRNIAQGRPSIPGTHVMQDAAKYILSNLGVE